MHSIGFEKRRDMTSWHKCAKLQPAVLDTSGPEFNAWPVTPAIYSLGLITRGSVAGYSGGNCVDVPNQREVYAQVQERQRQADLVRMDAGMFQVAESRNGRPPLMCKIPSTNGVAQPYWSTQFSAWTSGVCGSECKY